MSVNPSLFCKGSQLQVIISESCAKMYVELKKLTFSPGATGMLLCFGSSVHGIFQARILEWVAISFPGDLPDPGIETTFPVSYITSRFFIHWAIGKPTTEICHHKKINFVI